MPADQTREPVANQRVYKRLGSPDCKNCGSLRSDHGGFARCPGGATQYEPEDDA